VTTASSKQRGEFVRDAIAVAAFIAIMLVISLMANIIHFDENGPEANGTLHYTLQSVLSSCATQSMTLVEVAGLKSDFQTGVFEDCLETNGYEISRVD